MEPAAQNADREPAEGYYARAEAMARVLSDVGGDVSPRTVTRIGIVGAGTMGGGIAMNFINVGLPVVLVETGQNALERGIATVRANYERSASKGKLTQQDVEQRMALITPSLELGDLRDCDLIIEAIFEDMAIKQQLFARLDKVAKPGAILATNTSYLDVNQLASSSGRPQDVLGLHFFSPANVMKLLEVVEGRSTSPEVLLTAMSLGGKIGKIPVRVGVCHGFVGNRMLAARRRQAFSLIEEGAMPWDVDRVLEEFGMPMGPFAMTDLAGLDIGWSPEKSQGTVLLRDRLCELGRRGQKTGAGYYRYDPSTRKRSVDPDVERLVTEFALRSGRPQRSISDREILERCLYASVNEGAKILDEGIAQRASDIDVIWVNGYGWPKSRGGPMFWADGVGLSAVLDSIQGYEALLGEEWRPANGLRERVAQGQSFTR